MEEVGNIPTLQEGLSTCEGLEGKIKELKQAIQKLDGKTA